MPKLTLYQVSKALSSAGKITITKEEVFDDITKMAQEIHLCPRRNSSGRTYKQVFNNCSNIVVEYALAKILGGERNPNEFNSFDPESYRWDVRVDDTYFEVKRHALGTKWFSYPEDGIKTFKKYALTLDYFVSGYMEIYTDYYIVEFALVANAKTFFDYYRQSLYKNQIHFFHHEKALQNKQCDIINMRECTYKGTTQ